MPGNFPCDVFLNTSTRSLSNLPTVCSTLIGASIGWIDFNQRAWCRALKIVRNARIFAQ
jgi:hypothetical protein